MVLGKCQVTVLETKNGRFLSGIIKQQTERTLTVQTQNESVVVAKDDVESRQESAVSMMPEGLFDKLTRDEVRDLIGYPSGPAQLPLPGK